MNHLAQSELRLYTLVGVYLLVSALYNRKTLKYSNKVTVPVLGIGLVFCLLSNQLLNSLLGILILGIPMAFAIWKNGLGYGDLKLMMGVALLVGFKISVLCLIYSSLGMLIGFFLLHRYKAPCLTNHFPSGFLWFGSIMLSFVTSIFIP